MPTDAHAIWQAKPNRLWRPAPQSDLASVGFERAGIANQTGAREVGAGDRQGSVRCRYVRAYRTQVRHPRTNGFVERMNRTLLDECFRVKGRPTWYTSAEEIQRDLDQYLTFYNLKRSHQDYRLKGHTPAQALREALGRKKLPTAVPIAEKEVP